LNQKLSEARAESVRKALVNRYGIAASRLTTQGMGATDELFDEIDFNRVATFTDMTK
jgi:outer membrane protein OmpA-like peptidoglycan-associated protein